MEMLVRRSIEVGDEVETRCVFVFWRCDITGPAEPGRDTAGVRV